MDRSDSEQMVATIDALLPSSFLFACICNRKLAKNGMQRTSRRELKRVDVSALLVLPRDDERNAWQRSKLVCFVDRRASLQQHAELHAAEVARLREVIQYQIQKGKELATPNLWRKQFRFLFLGEFLKPPSSL